jgi:hypothetical protein
VLAGDEGGEWISYQYRTAHPILRWLPTKLAEWIGDIYGPKLGIAQKKMQTDGPLVNSILFLRTTLSRVQRVIFAPLDALSGSQNYLMVDRSHAAILLIFQNIDSEDRILRYNTFQY